MSDNEPPQSDDPPRKGRGHPPTKNRFPPGRRGPGRPLGSKNKPKGLTLTESLLYEDAHRLVPLRPPTEAGKQPDASIKQPSIPMVVAVSRAQAKAGLSGNSKAQKDYIDRTERLEKKFKDADDAALAFFEAYVRDWENLKLRHSSQRLADYEKTLLPHPDDVNVDLTTRKIRILGPATTLERRMWNEGLAALEQARSKVLSMREDAHSRKTDRRFQYELLMWTMAFVDNNDKLPTRHQLPCLPRWDHSDNPMFYEIAPPVDWSGAEA